MYHPEMNLFDYTYSTWLIFGWFNVFIAKICFIVLGMRRGIPLSLMLNLTLLFTLGGALGAIIAPSIMSVIIFSALLFYLGKLILNIDQPLGNLLAINYALAIGIGRLGCLLNGCCFGTVTTLPWGVAYPAGTLPHRLHSADGYIDILAPGSLTVHPIPLYETMFLLICALILYLCRNKRTAWREISLPMFLGVYCLFRMVMEQIRAHTNVWWSVVQIGPLSVFQWLLLVGATTLFTICILMKSKKALILQTAHRFNFEQSQLILLSASLVMIIILRSRLFEIHQVQLGLLWLSGAAIYAANILEIRFQRWVPVAGWSLALIILLVFPFYSGLQGQLPVHQGQLSVTQQRSGIVYNIWHSESNKLVRLGEEQLYPARFHTINSYLNLTATDTVTERQFIERLNGNWRTEHYFSVAGGYFQIETCGGVDPYGYFGAAYGIQALKLTGNGQEIGIFNRIALQQHWRTSTKLELSANSIIHFDRPYSGLGFGISATTFDVDQGVNVLPAAHLRLGSLRRNFSVGFMDQTMLATEPWYGHISWNWISTDSVRFQLGLSNFSYVFAFYLSAQNQKTGWNYYVLPPLDSETMGFGLRLTHHF